MAERRMFSKSVTESDAFLDMPHSARSLYFALSMGADDDGFVNNPKKIQKMARCGAKDMKLLIEEDFIIPFASGVVVIKHWKINNQIRIDRYKPTVCEKEKALLRENTIKAYELIAERDVSVNTMSDVRDTAGIPRSNQTDTARIPLSDTRGTGGRRTGRKSDTDGKQAVVERDTQYSIGKDSIGEYSIGEYSIGEYSIGEDRLGEDRVAEDGISASEANETDATEAEGFSFEPDEKKKENQTNKKEEDQKEDDNEAPVGSLPLSDGTVYYFYSEQVDALGCVYLHVNILSEISKMMDWVEQKSCRLKPGNVDSFIQGWLQKAEAREEQRPDNRSRVQFNSDWNKFFEAARAI